jgi:hypothetical protein
MLIKLGYILDDVETDVAKYYLTVRNGNEQCDDFKNGVLWMII